MVAKLKGYQLQKGIQRIYVEKSRYIKAQPSQHDLRPIHKSETRKMCVVDAKKNESGNPKQNEHT